MAFRLGTITDRVGLSSLFKDFQTPPEDVDFGGTVDGQRFGHDEADAWERVSYGADNFV